MRNSIIILMIAFATLVVFQSFIATSTKNIEKQPYRVIKKEKEFEIRYYPAATMATIKSKANTYKELSNSGFKKIAGYIFGGNETSTKIAMTSPVHMEINEKGSSMSFVMPSEYSLTTLPRPNNSQVEIHESKPEYVAAIEFGGYVNDATLKKYTDLLQKTLKYHNIKTIGHFRYLGYNPPYQFINRRNEVIIEVVWKE